MLHVPFKQAFAATLYSGSASQTVSVGETFVVEWFLNTEGEPVNVVSLNLKFTTDTLEMMEVSKGNSLLSLWIREPSFSNADGTITLAGGIPGGLSASGVPVFRTMFRGKKAGPAQISMEPSSSALKHDGRGTPTLLTHQTLNFIVSSEGYLPISVSSPTHPDQTKWYQDRRTVIKFTPKAGERYSYSFSANLDVIPDREVDAAAEELVYDSLPDGIYYFKLNVQTGADSFQEAGFYRVQIDGSPPEEFLPEISRDPSVFAGQPFVNFFSVDKTSGISHYEIKVGAFSRFHETQSPAKISKPLVGDTVTLKAIDRAGNAREVSIGYKALLPLWLLVVIVICLLMAMVILGLKLKHKARNT